MFTEGLDESAINWINQGKETDQVPKIRSPLTEKIGPHDSFPKSPLTYNTATLLSPHVLPPPLKFRSGLLGPHSVIAPTLDDEEDGLDDESVASVSDDIFGGDAGIGNFSDEEEMFDRTSKCSSMLIRGFSKLDLKVDLPNSTRRFTDGDLGIRDFANKSLSTSVGLRERVQLHNAHGAIGGHVSNTFKDVEDLGTPSAPPILDIGREGSDTDMEIEEEFEQIQDEIYNPVQADCFDGSKEGLQHWKSQSLNCSGLGEESINEKVNGDKEENIPYGQSNISDDLHSYNASGQYAWQTLIAYDACIRLCLYSWARGCPEAPEFLRDECILLRSAFGLHKFLLQPRGVQPVEVSTTKSVEQVSMKAKKVVGKIRVEVKKLRIISRRKLKSVYSQRSAMYMQVGAEYVRHVSSLVKNGVNSLKIASFPVATEEPFSCFFQLKSATEDTKVEPSSAICLHPGCGDYHVFFPETEGDALLVEVQDKNLVQGRATILVSSLSDHPNERIRWWPIYHEDEECVGKIQLSIGSTITCDETSQIKSGTVVETLAYDLLHEASMRAQRFHSRNLRLQGPWQWLLTEFADYYGVSDSYTKLRYLSHVMNVATPTKDCLELVNELLVPILKARNEKSLTRQEKSILLGCETQIESLLANAFEHYKSLDEKSLTGLADLFGPIQETAAPALPPAVQVYTLLHDILSPDAQTTLRNYLQTATKKRCRKHMMETDEFVSSNSEGFLLDPITISTAYLKMKYLCLNISKEIQADIKIHNQHILPSSIDLSNITAAVYSTELCKRLTGFLAAWPPSCPASHVNELLIAIADFERDLESWNISPVQGGVDSRSLFHNYIVVWVEDMQLKLLDLCKAEKVPWSGE